MSDDEITLFREPRTRGAFVMGKRFSIVIRTQGDRLYLLKKALESVEGQSFDHAAFEVIVVNDGGPSVLDVTTQFEGKFDLQTVENFGWVGKAEALNVGFSRTHGEYICVLDEDDVFYDDHLRVLAHAIEEFDRPAVLYCDVDLAVENDRGETVVVGVHRWEYDPSSLATLYDSLIICSACFDRNAWDAVGGFDPYFTRVLDDWDFLIRLTTKFEFIHVGSVTTRYSVPAHNKSFQDVEVFSEGLGRIYTKFNSMPFSMSAATAHKLAERRIRSEHEIAKREVFIEGFRRAMNSQREDTYLERLRFSIDIKGTLSKSYCNQIHKVDIRLSNETDRRINSGGGRAPVSLSYHWKDLNGAIVVWDGLRTPLFKDLDPGDTIETTVLVQAPEHPGEYVLEVTGVQEGVLWAEVVSKCEVTNEIRVHVVCRQAESLL